MLGSLLSLLECCGTVVTWPCAPWKLGFWALGSECAHLCLGALSLFRLGYRQVSTLLLPAIACHSICKVLPAIARSRASQAQAQPRLQQRITAKANYIAPWSYCSAILLPGPIAQRRTACQPLSQPRRLAQSKSAGSAAPLAASTTAF